MVINTKFNVGDKVLAIANNKAMQIKVKSINVSVRDAVVVTVYASTTDSPFDETWSFCEGEAFATKDELLKSL